MILEINRPFLGGRASLGVLRSGVGLLFPVARGGVACVVSRAGVLDPPESQLSSCRFDNSQRAALS